MKGLEQITAFVGIMALKQWLVQACVSSISMIAYCVWQNKALCWFACSQGLNYGTLASSLPLGKKSISTWRDNDCTTRGGGCRVVQGACSTSVCTHSQGLYRGATQYWPLIGSATWFILVMLLWPQVLGWVITATVPLDIMPTSI